MRSPWLLGAATFVVMAMPATASAQFMYRLNLNSIGATTCPSSGPATVVSGDADWILPPSSGNVRIVRRVNGLVLETTFDSVTPFNADNVPVSSVIFGQSLIALTPYTASAEVLPFANGAPVGTGVLATWNCDAQGGGTFEAVAIAAPPPVPPVPAMSRGGLLALAALLAAAAFAVRARRRAPG